MRVVFYEFATITTLFPNNRKGKVLERSAVHIGLHYMFSLKAFAWQGTSNYFNVAQQQPHLARFDHQDVLPKNFPSRNLRTQIEGLRWIRISGSALP